MRKCLPGRPLSLDFTFFGKELVEVLTYTYNDMVCLTDCCIATFEHDLFRKLFETDRAFAFALMRAAMNLMGDISQFAALERADSVYTEVSLLMQKLMEFDLYLSRSDISNVLACNRTSVSRAFARIEEERPEFFARYVANKNRPTEYFRPRS